MLAAKFPVVKVKDCAQEPGVSVALWRETLRDGLGLGAIALVIALANYCWYCYTRPVEPDRVYWADLQGQQYTLVDARSPEQFQAGHLAGAYSLPGLHARELPLPADLRGNARTPALVVYADRHYYVMALLTARTLAQHRRDPIRILLDPPLP